MEQQETVFEVGSHVQIMSYGPFRGLRGTIRTVDMIAADREDEEPFGFYQITLEGAHIQEPVWFEYDEVELVASPSLVPQGRGWLIKNTRRVLHE
jgi:hypothetical protein